jgi:SAM-dependent methyltransferase
MDNKYDDQDAVAAIVRAGEHRNKVGGFWEEVGRLQFEFLLSNGLKPSDHLLDIGCGCLRGGVHFASYLARRHYWGIDSNQSLLDVGYDVELKLTGLTRRVSRSQLLCNDEFRFDLFQQTFDMAIACSLFTHLPANRIKLCMYRLAKVTRPGGRLFATYFEVPENHPFDEAFGRPQGISTLAYKDPFHYQVLELRALTSGMPWRLEWSGEWNHPRGQSMAIFERGADSVPAA